MKKAFMILGAGAVSAAAGGLTAWAVAGGREGSVQYIEREVERTPALGAQFPSYQADQYPALTYAAENAVKAVVNIEAIQQVEMPQRRGGYDPFLEFFGIPQDYGRGDGRPQYREQRAGGSGVIISGDGYIVTNNHVVAGADALKVSVGGEEYDADVVGTDESSDIAVIKLRNASGLTPVEIGDSDNLTIGEWVMSIGSPFGLEQSVATGIVSATSRSQIMSNSESSGSDGYGYGYGGSSSQSGGYTIYPNKIQTHAAINPGNSGGALVDSNGKLIGINTLITSYSGNYSGVGFAIPVNYAVNIAQQIIEGKTPTHAQLGVSLSTVTSQNAKR